MPNLTILAACERVLIDRGGLPSLINIFQRMNLTVVNPIQADAVVPNQWAVFALWQHSDDELNLEFTQHLEVLAPDGETFLTGITKFKTTEIDDRQSKNSINILGLPIWAEGMVTVNIWLEGFESSKHSYRFHVKYLPKGGETNSLEAKAPSSAI
jgi:hypothetical protein